MLDGSRVTFFLAQLMDVPWASVEGGDDDDSGAAEEEDFGFANIEEVDACERVCWPHLHISVYFCTLLDYLRVVTRLDRQCYGKDKVC